MDDIIIGNAQGSSLKLDAVIWITVGSCILGLIWAFINYLAIKKICLTETTQGQYEGLTGEVTEHQIKLLLELGQKISEGAKQFLKQEYAICLVFIVIMFIIIYGAVDEFKDAYTAIAFVIGALTSITCGIIGMAIATYTNFRVTYNAKKGLAQAFRTAYRGGTVMGFALVSIALLTLIIVIVIYKKILQYGDSRDIIDGFNESGFDKLFESVAGYGLGGSTVALFGRVGGGIYTKAADVGADLVGKVEKDLPEDSPKNPATIADNVGDNVGDIAGMGADLFGSFAEATCAALVISSTTLTSSAPVVDTTTFYSVQITTLMYPILLMAFGIVLSFITSFVGVYISNVDVQKKIEDTLKVQIVLSTVLLIAGLFGAAYLTLPDHYDLIIDSRPTYYYSTQNYLNKKPYHAAVCSLFGLISGMVIGIFTEYMTSHTYFPVRELAGSCRTGAATNIIYGLALGYLSTIIPVIFIAITAYFTNRFLGYYGVALGALGMLSNLPISLAIDGYGPISDNAGGIAQMAEMGEDVRTKTDALDAAGNTTAAIGKGFAIGSAALVGLALYGGFLHNSTLIGVGLVGLTQPLVFAGLFIGAMLPYAFSAFTMKSVGKAALGMVEEIRRQIKENPGILKGQVEPDYKACIRISTRASLIQMIAPGCLVIFTPMLGGIAFGSKAIAGFLPGAIVSGVQLAISAANTGGAWDNAKKYVQGGNMIDDQGNVIRKGSEVHKAAVVGDTVGDPLKDTSGPSLNILIKLMAILSLVFATLFLRIHPIHNN